MIPADRFGPPSCASTLPPRRSGASRARPFVGLLAGLCTFLASCLDALEAGPRGLGNARDVVATDLADTTSGAPAPCELGERRLCTCNDGSQYFATCLSTGIFDLCPCPVIDCAGGCGHLDGPCVKGVCLETLGCTKAPAHGDFCDDANPCTTLDRCVRGLCLGAPVRCADGDLCSADSCASSGTCEHAPRTECVDLANDPNNCGEEGIVCPGGADARCEGGHCTACRVTYEGPRQPPACALPLRLQCPNMPPQSLISARFVGEQYSGGTLVFGRIAWTDGRIDDPTRGGCLASDATCPSPNTPCGLPVGCGVRASGSRDALTLELERYALPAAPTDFGVFYELIDKNGGCTADGRLTAGATLTVWAEPALSEP